MSNKHYIKGLNKLIREETNKAIKKTINSELKERTNKGVSVNYKTLSNLKTKWTLKHNVYTSQGHINLAYELLDQYTSEAYFIQILKNDSFLMNHYITLQDLKKFEEAQDVIFSNKTYNKH